MTQQRKEFLMNLELFFFRTIALVLCAVSLWSCGSFKTEHNPDVVAECCGQVLTLEELEKLTDGFTGEDSVRIAEEYIKNWAVELLMYESSHRVDSRNIEALVEDYRRSLYIYEYEQLLISQEMSMEVSESLIREYYNAHQEQLVLQEMLLKGALVVLPLDAPNQDHLRRHLASLNNSNSLEAIEKYVYQYGVGYELFAKEWKAREEVLACVPIEISELDQVLARNKLIEVRDSMSLYLLQVTDFRPAGSIIPLEYARKRIEANILGARSKDFIRNVRQELYDKSVKKGKLKRYEK
jgi:hypothetical protein